MIDRTPVTVTLPAYIWKPVLRAVRWQRERLEKRSARRPPPEGTADLDGMLATSYGEAERDIALALTGPPRRHKAPEGECLTCDGEAARGNDFHPPHDASARCESGRREHCSCDVCF